MYITPSTFSIPKGHRPPPIGSKPGEEPAVEGWSRSDWLLSESYAGVEKNHALKQQYPDQTDPRIADFWAAQGIRRDLYDTDHDFDDRGNAKYAFAVLSPLTWQEGRVYPVLYFSHGGGANNYDAEVMGFSNLIAEEQFIAVYPENGGFSNQEVLSEFPRILNFLEQKGYPMDWSRIYAAGFSAGSDATESLGTQYPEVLAAVAPCPGSNAMYNSLNRVCAASYEKARKLRVPLCCAGGTADFGDRFPFPDEECFENFNIWASEICKVPGYQPTTLEIAQARMATTRDLVVQMTGLPFHRTEIQEAEGRKWLIGDFLDEANAPVVHFVIGQDIPHELTNYHIRQVWNWLKCWQRDPQTGNSIYTAL
jgi:hypothetical protein